MRAALLVAVALDAAVGDPPRWHPVAGFGRAAGGLERVVWRDTRSAGAAFAAVCAGVPAVCFRRLPLAGAAWICLGGTSLGRVAGRLSSQLRTGDLDAVRAGLPALCGRDPATLSADALARAVVESVAENTSDAAVAPLLWAAVGGAPGVVAYRCVNTLDAMVGHRSQRYARFGWAAARADDLANLLPARLTAGLTVLCAPLVGGSPGAAWRGWRRDGGQHPSPNAGPCEAAFAGALGVRLGGPLSYDGRREDRPLLGTGRAPTADDIDRAVRLSRAVTLAAALLLTCAPMNAGARSRGTR